MSQADETQMQPPSAMTEVPEGVPRIGDVILEKYTVERILGMGGMGVVVSARHLQLGELAAIKFLLPRMSRNPETVARFMREARATAKIKSEHIVRVMDVGSLPSGAPYILMEHLEGKDLANHLRASGPLAVNDAIDFVLQACVAIAEAHALGIVHRDLKPSNLFLTSRSDGTLLIKVLDFGIAKAVDEKGIDNPNLTDTLAVFGSPSYMSPEQIRSAKNCDVRTDVWALGVILYELLTGHPPFAGETAGALLVAIAADAPQSLRSRRKDAPEELETIVGTCLQKNVVTRFQSVSELASALAPLAVGTSQISVDRVMRLSQPPGPAARPSQPVSSVGAFAATEKPWTTKTGVGAPSLGPKVSGKVTQILLGSAAGALAMGLIVAVLRSSGDQAAATASSNAPSVVPSVATPQLMPIAPPVEAHATQVTPQTTPIVAAPDAGAVPTSTALARSARPERVPPRTPVLTSTASAEPVPSAPLPPAPPKRDPTDTSH